MRTSANYNRAFWNSIRTGNTGNTALNEGCDKSVGAYTLPTESETLYTAALEKRELVS